LAKQRRKKDRRIPKEQNEKISKGLLGRIQSPETRNKIGEGNSHQYKITYPDDSIEVVKNFKCIVEKYTYNRNTINTAVRLHKIYKGLKIEKLI
jgi:hypothetical protein